MSLPSSSGSTSNNASGDAPAAAGSGTSTALVPSPSPVSPLASTPDILARVKQTRLALFKALHMMISSKLQLSRFCMCTLVASRRILSHYSIRFAVRVGYTSMPGSQPPLCYPHVWLETEIDDRTLITDLCYSGPLRIVSAVGQAIGFAEEAVAPTYSMVPTVTVCADAMKNNMYHRLKQEASDIDGYVSRAGPAIRAELDRIIAKALDGTAVVDVEVADGETK